MLMHCVLMTFSAHIISQWFLCLKCSLVCVCYGRKRLYHAQARGFVAPNTGDRLCGSTACEWAYKVSLVIQNSPSLMFNARVCQPLLFMFRLPGPGISAVSHAATWPWKWLSLWSARSSRVEFNRVGGDDSNRHDILNCVLWILWGEIVRKPIAWYHFCAKYKSIYIWRQSDANALRLNDVLSSHHFTTVFVPEM